MNAFPTAFRMDRTVCRIVQRLLVFLIAAGLSMNYFYKCDTIIDKYTYMLLYFAIKYVKFVGLYAVVLNLVLYMYKNVFGKVHDGCLGGLSNGKNVYPAFDVVSLAF